MALRRSSRIATTIAVTTKKIVQASRSTDIATTQARDDVDRLSSLSPLTSNSDENPRPPKRKRADVKSKAATDGEDKSPPMTQKRARRGKSPPREPTLDDFTPRVTNRWKIGPHVSSSGGVESSVVNAAAVGYVHLHTALRAYMEHLCRANAFAIFLKSQRKWESNALKEESITKFKARMKAFGYSASHVLPHGSYLVNLGNPDK